jgi:hypothetical protein
MQKLTSCPIFAKSMILEKLANFCLIILIVGMMLLKFFIGMSKSALLILRVLVGNMGKILSHTNICISLLSKLYLGLIFLLEFEGFI